MQRTLVAIAVGASLVGLFVKLSAAESDAKGVEFFEKKIRPVLVERCYQCHSAEAEKAKKLKGGLFLDSREGMRKGGDTGPAVVPGKVKQSLLLSAIRHENLKMPPKGKLPDEVVADFVQWVTMGAPDPRAGVPARTKTVALEEGRKHWAFQPIRRAEPPTVKNETWPRGDIDRFILARLEAQGLAPVRDAEKRVLLRRVYFDLVGLPPSIEETDAFLADSSSQAFEKVVERLLASPRFGERWGRHWLDIVRYAESNGNADNIPFPQAWRYRDYVIASFNADKPYDQFLREQIAGDLLPAGNPREHNEHLIATGFLALGSKPRAQNNPNFAMDLVADQIEVTGTALLGLTVACARCHDHKFDPIPTTEYYALAGIFNSTQMLYGSGSRKGGAKGISAGGLHTLETEDGQATAEAMGVRESGKPANCPVCIRGESANRGEIVPRGFLSVAAAGPAPAIGSQQSGRLELAQWLTDPKHPLTARVMVNRVWHHLFGSGLVPTVDNFGLLGDRPSHPELLDTLAARFTDEGWSIKRLIRALVLSRTYQLGSENSKNNYAKDPANRLLWHRSLRRLDAESLRDSVLSTSGQLQLGPPGGTTAIFEGNRKNPAAQKDHRFRSVYLPVVRNSVPEILSVFDFADASLVVGSREVTTVPSQSLFLINSPFMVEQSRLFAKHVLAIDEMDDRGRLERAYRLAYARPSTDAEGDRALQYLGQCAEDLKTREKDPKRAREAAWASLCQALLVSAEFRYVE